MFVAARLSQPSLMFEVRELERVRSTLTPRLGRKGLQGTNTLAYCSYPYATMKSVVATTELITQTCKLQLRKVL